MIPKKIILQNFLSYRQAELDFSQLHTACICGENGAGKSSLLEAISWAVWGKTRASSDDDLVYLGQKDMRVDYEFFYNQQIYRIIRSRRKKGSGSLDFQIKHNDKYQSISGKGIKDTGDKIVECLKIDYHTFINSAYLRQGRADEFMQNKPAERKKILANLLKLDQYDILANEAKDLAKQYKIRSEETHRHLEEQKSQIEAKETIELDLKNTNQELIYHQDKLEQVNSQLQKIKTLNNNRISLFERLNWQKNQLQNSNRKISQLNQEKQSLEQDLAKINSTLQQQETITNNYQKLEYLRKEDNELNIKFNLYQKLLINKQSLEKQLNQTTNKIILETERQKANLDNLLREEKELQKIVGNSHNLTAELETLQSYRQRLAQLDELQLQITPLRQKKQTIQNELKAKASKLEAKLEQLIKQENQLKDKLAQVPVIRDKFLNLEKQLQTITDSRNYQKRIKEKGEKQKELQQQYYTDKNSLIKQMKELQKKLKTLHQDHAICPLCERDLDETHLHQVIQKTETQKQQIESESWYLEEQIIDAQRKLDELRTEYAQINQELAIEDSLKQQQAKLENKLESSDELREESEQLEAEKQEIEELLINHKFAVPLTKELEQIIQQIKELNYNEEDHTLLRKQEADLRKVEYQQLKIKDSQKKLAQILQRKPQLETKIVELEKQLQEITKTSDLQLKINAVESEIKELDYDTKNHNQIRQLLQELRPYQILYSDLQQAQKQHLPLTQKLEQITTNLKQYQVEKNNGQEELDKISQQLNKLTDYSGELSKLETESSFCRQNLNDLLTKKGRLEQSIHNLEDREEILKQLSAKVQDIDKNHRIYDELTKAFGKNGIQSLMIENILPQLEIEANHILSRLTANQLHVQFVTQKPMASNTKSNTKKFKDTLEIIIADANGSRSYETYSGGEAFRINFSIRLALSRILAQRSGTPLQLLIIDEGFGTQDSHGCERLIAALNAIASEFACILTVTHVTQFKEAFDTRIEVYKTENGSQIRLSS